MAITRIYNVTPTTDGSGDILADIELLQADGAPSGLKTQTRLTPAQTVDLLTIHQTQGLPAVCARLLEIAGQIDARFTAAAVAAYLTGNATSAAHVGAIMAAVALPLDVEV
jgi:hypothetical protein